MHINDGSGAPPRLMLQQSWWGMAGLPQTEREWSIEQKIERIASAGFAGILGDCPPPLPDDEWRALLDEHGLTLGLNAFCGQVEELEPYLERAQELGALYINAQVNDAFVVGDRAIDLLQELHEYADEAGVPLLIETHRGRITQDLLRTVEYVKALPEMNLTIDLSHYVVAGEMGGAHPLAERAFDTLLERTGAIHGRVSNGEQVQIDIGDGSGAVAQRFLGWWRKGMSAWRAAAKPGDILPFVSELGPPGYAIALADGVEPSDRWEQALVLKRLAESAWASAGAQRVRERA